MRGRRGKIPGFRRILFQVRRPPGRIGRKRCRLGILTQPLRDARGGPVVSPQGKKIEHRKTLRRGGGSGGGRREVLGGGHSCI